MSNQVDRIGDQEFRTKPEFQAAIDKRKTDFFKKGGKIEKIGVIRNVDEARKSIAENQKPRDPLKTSREYQYD